MEPQLLVFGSWFSFAIIAYLVLICLFGFVWLYRIQSRSTAVEWGLVSINLVFMVLGFTAIICTIVLYATLGKAFLDRSVNSTSNAHSYYVALFFTNLVLTVLWVFFVMLFSNNFVIKFTDEKIYLFGLSIINSAIINIKRGKHNVYYLEYVFKKSGTNKWTEKCRFWSWFGTTKYLLDNYRQFFDVERNKAFYDLDKITKPPATDKPTAAKSTTAATTTVKAAAPVKPIGKSTAANPAKPTPTKPAGSVKPQSTSKK